ncbi:MAG: hypothetical protein RLZZ63_324 [Gemmatimonadota bacterium]|jgi:hypothetical protein
MHLSAYFTLFLLNPFFAAVFSLARRNQRNLTLVAMCFCAFYGASQLISNEKDNGRYRDKFYEMHDRQVTWTSFRESLWDGQTTVDVAIPLISFVAALVTRNERILFAVFGIVFGFFYGRNLQFVYSHLPRSKIPPFLALLVAVAALVVPFWAGLSSVRMWMGAHVFFYGASRYMSYKQARYLLFVAAAGLVHFSFTVVALMFAAFYFTRLRRREGLWFALFVATFLFAEIGAGTVREIIRGYAPAIYESKAEAYTEGSYVEDYSELTKQRSWHARYYQPALFYSICFLLVLTYRRTRRRRILTDVERAFLSFAFVVFAFANSITFLPAGSRFYWVASLFAMIPIIKYYQHATSRTMIHLTTIPILFWLVVSIRDGFDLITLATIISNPVIIWGGGYTDISLMSFIK